MANCLANSCISYYRKAELEQQRRSLEMNLMSDLKKVVAIHPNASKEQCLQTAMIQCTLLSGRSSKLQKALHGEKSKNVNLKKKLKSLSAAIMANRTTDVHVKIEFEA